jgi:hypothetical protein
MTRMKNAVSWDVAPCISCVTRRFGGNYRLQPPAHAGSSLVDLSTLKMEGICSSETSVHTRSTRRHIPEDGILHSHRRENPKSYYGGLWGKYRCKDTEHTSSHTTGIPYPRNESHSRLANQCWLLNIQVRTRTHHIIFVNYRHSLLLSWNKYFTKLSIKSQLRYKNNNSPIVHDIFEKTCISLLGP